MKLIILTTHPIQYQVPWFRLLHQDPNIDLIVLFCMLPDAEQQGEGFGLAFQWDTPLLDGYEYRVLENVAAAPSVTQFAGCDTPQIHPLLKAERPDAVIVNGWVVKSCLQTLWACRRLRIPCFVRGESNNLRPRAFWKRCMHRVLLAHYRGFLSIGKANRSFYRDAGVRSEQIFNTPYCVDNEFFKDAVKRVVGGRARIREKFGLHSEIPVALFVGKFEEKKRPFDFVEAISRTQGLQGLMVGDGDLHAQCCDRAEQLSASVYFAGFLNQGEIGDAYAAADFLVLPSDHGETWGLVVNEAMACGLPAVVSDQVGCHPDLIVHDETGYVYPMGDVEGLAAILATCARNMDHLRGMGTNAQKRVSSYNFDEVTCGVRGALESLVGPV